MKNIVYKILHITFCICGGVIGCADSLFATEFLQPPYCINLPPQVGIFSEVTCKSESEPVRIEHVGNAGVVFMGHTPQQFLWGVAIAPLLEDYTESDVTGIYFGISGQMNNMTGVQVSVLNQTTSCSGLQMGVISNFSDSSFGAQAAIINAVSDFSGLQLGLINSQGKYPKNLPEEKSSTENVSSGNQVGILNVATGAGNVVQLGIVNVQKDKGVQIGLLNFSSNGFLPFFPLVNFSL